MFHKVKTVQILTKAISFQGTVYEAYPTVPSKPGQKCHHQASLCEEGKGQSYSYEILDVNTNAPRV